MSPAPIAIVDTNVFIAAILSRSGEAPSRRIVRGLISGRVPFVTSPAFLAEYAIVAQRREMVRRHHLEGYALAALLRAVAEPSVQPDPAPLSAPDPNDQHLWDLAASVPDAVIVTLDQALLAAPDPPCPVITPAIYAERYLDPED